MKAPAFTGLFVAACLIPTLSLFRLVGLDESIFAHVAREAAEQGRWLPLTWGGEPFCDKPPLQIWMMGLALRLLGGGEAALRLPSALFAGLAAGYSFAVARRAFGTPAAAAAAAMLLLAEHFILYGRTATLDMALAACICAALYHAGGALDSGEARARRQWWLTGLWVAAGLWVKLHVAVIVLPACLLAAAPAARRTWPSILLRVGGPAAAALALLCAAYAAAYGPEFWTWAFSIALTRRAGQAASGGGAALSAGLSYYGEILRLGLPFLWPLLPLGMARLWKERAAAGVRVMLLFAGLYAGAFLFLTAPLINYVAPMLPFAALAAAAAVAGARGGPGLAALGLALLGGLLSGLGRWDSSPLLPLGLALAAPLALLLPLPGPSRGLKWAALGTACLFAAAMLVQSGRYLLRPPDPNRQWVAALRGNPGPAPGALLLFQGDHVTARVLSYYSGWKVLALGALPRTSPGPAMLGPGQDGPVFTPPAGRLDRAALRLALRAWEPDPKPGVIGRRGEEDLTALGI